MGLPVALARGRCVEQQAFALDNILALQFHLELTPQAIRSLITRYGSDLEQVSACVQSAEDILQDLEARARRLYAIADVVFERWLHELHRNQDRL